MTTYHPEYDVDTQYWFISGTDYEAKTIRELKTKLEPDAEIKDYYPQGMGYLLSPINPPKHATAIVPFSFKPLPIKRELPMLAELPKSIEPAPKPSRNRIWLITEVNEVRRDLVEGKLSYAQIGQKLGRSKNSIFAQIKRLGLRKKETVTRG
jgi:hypothetical protein